MFTKQGLRLLHGWIHASLDILLDHAASIPAKQFAREIEGFGYASIRAQFVHTLQVEEGWVRLLHGLRWVEWPTAPLKGVEDVRLAKLKVMDNTLAYLDAIAEQELNQVLPLRPTEWYGDLRSPAFMLHHLIIHASHHKGQMAAMFRFLGHPAPDTDLHR